MVWVEVSVLVGAKVAGDGVDIGASAEGEEDNKQGGYDAFE